MASSDPESSLDGRMSSDSLSSSAEKQLHIDQLCQVVLVEKPRHLVEDKEDLERLFPRCPPNTLESAARQSRKSKRRTAAGSVVNNNNEIENGPGFVYRSETPLDSKTPVANIIDLVRKITHWGQGGIIRPQSQFLTLIGNL